ncbi:hypothetical protein N8T08_005934 [Aspergillus melleus]|uniref:Uncharacterized protein n=1 Tax=Aspergillus melleus TaxID=138277 RepID=A0ACC3B1N1_9EURO|nr:hypothetical protein N8T08_005934 [Aspergillus melleus]
MAEPEEMKDVQVSGFKRPSVDLDGLQRKKFKTEELPLSAAQHAAIDHLLHAFKKKGGFDAIRKKVWAEFDEGEGKAEFTKLLVELAESEIDREPALLSRERGKAATLIEGAVDRSDVYKSVERSLDALASNHLPTILDSVRDIRRQEIGDEAAAQEERAGNKTDEDYAAHVKTKRDEREKEWQEYLRQQKEIEEQEVQRKEEEERKQREIKRQKEEEERVRRREREEQRRAEQRLLDEQREKDRQERYERRRREERDRYRDYDRYRDSDRSRTRDRDSDRDRDRYRHRDRSPGYRSDRGISPRYRDSRKDTSATPKEPTPAPPAPAAASAPAPPVDEKSLEEAALELLLKEGEELAAKARQKPEFDFEEAEAIENGLKPPSTRPKSSSDTKHLVPTSKDDSPAGESSTHHKRSSVAEDRPQSTRKRDESRSRSRRRHTSRTEEDRRDSRDTTDRPRDRDSDERLPIRDFRGGYGDRSYRPSRRSRSRSTTRGQDDKKRDLDRGRDDRDQRRSPRRELSTLDIDRYVPPTSNRSRSPRRRVRSPEREQREREERPRFGEADRYIPGGERDREQDTKEPERNRDAEDRRPRRSSPSRRRSRSR